jgi:hypothetical protein
VTGAIIALDARGRLGAICNTAAMPVAPAHGGAPVVARERPE